MSRNLTRKECLEVRAAQRMVEGIEEEIKKIAPMTIKDSVRGSSSEHPYTQHVFVIEGAGKLEDDPKYARLTKELNKRREEWLEKIWHLEEILRDMEPEEQDILRRYYINGQTMEEIGKDLGYAKSSVHKKINSYFGKE